MYRTSTAPFPSPAHAVSYFGSSREEEEMARYLLECPHTAEECSEALDSIVSFSKEAINRFDWGCKSGDHVGWAIVEAQDEPTARLFLPTNIRRQAKVFALNKFTAEDVASFHGPH
jgi:hypothetical protein